MRLLERLSRLLSLFFLMILPPPSFTLFPYTTLFRSLVRHEDRGVALHPREVDERPAQRGRGQDRKSTRLNSSHGYISYAVLCLKKKNYFCKHAARPTYTPLRRAWPVTPGRQRLTCPS